MKDYTNVMWTESIVSGYTHGRIFVDNVENPKTILTWFSEFSILNQAYIRPMKPMTFKAYKVCSIIFLYFHGGNILNSTNLNTDLGGNILRAPMQVLVIPYKLFSGIPEFCIFKRSDDNYWQFIAGGGESEDTAILISAKREAFEEANIDIDSKYFSLDTQCSIPSYCFKDARKNWGDDCFVIPEYSFAVMLEKVKLTLSCEHSKYEWVDYETAVKKLKYDSNRTALWELDSKIKLGLIN